MYDRLPRYLKPTSALCSLQQYRVMKKPSIDHNNLVKVSDSRARSPPIESENSMAACRRVMIM
eukprot:34443-Eustigmatos_ZCMA.PRE.1